jgi:hypothetical protein
MIIYIPDFQELDYPINYYYKAAPVETCCKKTVDLQEGNGFHHRCSDFYFVSDKRFATASSVAKPPASRVNLISSPAILPV